MDAVALSLFNQRLIAMCDEMGICLCRAAFSPNIRDRLDYSCAIFDTAGRLAAQAAHIPVHLGSMAYALERLVNQFNWQAGDMLVFNHPLYGGTHLPDITVVAPVFLGDVLIGFVANRAHHADIGAATPGGMPVSRSLAEEGLLIEPRYLVRGRQTQTQCLQELTACAGNPAEQRGDYLAQIAANNVVIERLLTLAEKLGPDKYLNYLAEINSYGRKLAQTLLKSLPQGKWQFTDYLDDDGIAQTDIKIQVSLEITASSITVDFAGTAQQVEGNVNCPPAVAFAAVYYVFRLFLPEYTPSCHGTFSWLRVNIPEDSLLNATGQAAVAGGNVETSSRIVDCLLGAFGQVLPERAVAASQGTMNNFALGSATAPAWSYYETIAGGCGASAISHGLTAVQSHMTNTLNTPIEILEMKYPFQIRRYAVRRGSGGNGKHRGGDGVVREYEFLKPTICTILSERRRYAPWGIAGGDEGMRGQNLLNNQPIAGKCMVKLQRGDRLTIMTPGGGGYGKEHG